MRSTANQFSVSITDDRLGRRSIKASLVFSAGLAAPNTGPKRRSSPRQAAAATWLPRAQKSKTRSFIMPAIQWGCIAHEGGPVSTISEQTGLKNQEQCWSDLLLQHCSCQVDTSFLLDGHLKRVWQRDLVLAAVEEYGRSVIAEDRDAANLLRSNGHRIGSRGSGEG
jgi:hypothetical protein